MSGFRAAVASGAATCPRCTTVELKAARALDKSIGVDIFTSINTTLELAPIACCAPLAAPVLSDEEAEATAKLFGALADPARVRILNALATSDEPVCVCNLTEPLGLAQPTVSHHMKRLVDAGLLEREQRGRWAYFTLRPDAVDRLAALADLKGART